MYTWNELYHHGIKGQKWYVRRFQNEDGTLTEAGKQRRRHYYGEDIKKPWNYGISQRAAEKYHQKLQDRKAEIDVTNKELKNAIGEETFQKVLDSVMNVIVKSDEGDFNEYQGKYRQEWDEMVKEVRAVEEKFWPVSDKFWATYRDLNAKDHDKAIEYYNSIAKDPMSEYSILRDQRHKLISQVQAKEWLYANDWLDTTIEQTVNSIPEKYRDAMYDIMMFDPAYDRD